MTAVSFRLAAASALLAIAAQPASAQRQPPSPEQRIQQLERQLQQVQRQVFPRGRPADTAGFVDEPAATQSSVRSLDERLTALERQLSEVLRLSEENGNRLRTIEADAARARSDQDNRLRALETAAAAAAAAAIPAPTPSLTAPVPPASASPGGTASRPAVQPGATPAADPAEIAYDEGFQHWRAGRFDQAITSLRAFTSAYPKHRRTSWANNLVGRALLDKGEPRAAAEALLANYRANPGGERAADSLFYLGQSLMRLGQPGQACKAYSELEDVYGAKMRDELKRLLPPAKSEAQCS